MRGMIWRPFARLPEKAAESEVTDLNMARTAVILHGDLGPGRMFLRHPCLLRDFLANFQNLWIVGQQVCRSPTIKICLSRPARVFFDVLRQDNLCQPR